MSDPEHDIMFLACHAMDDMELCEATYQIICNSPQKKRAHLLEMFFIYSAQMLRDYLLKLQGGLCKDAEWRCQANCKDAIREYLVELAEKNKPTDDFYSTLWMHLSDDILFPSPEAKVAALYCCLNSYVLPYFSLNTETDVSLDKEISRISKSFGERCIAELQYILSATRITAHQKAIYLTRLVQKKNRLAEKAATLLLAINFYETQIEAWDVVDFGADEKEDDRT